MLLADWFECLAREAGLDFSQRGSSGQAYTLGDPSAFSVIARFIEYPPFLEFVPSDKSRDDLIANIVAKAVAHVERADLGGVVWYSTELHEVELRFSPLSLIGPFLQRLGSQTRIAGWRRLGASILLEFVEKEKDPPSGEKHILVPKAIVNVHIVAPGPCAGHFSSHVAHGVVETVGAVCTFALGRPVELPHTVFPAKAETVAQLDKRRTDGKILTLARKGTSLDIFSPLAADGGLDLFRRVRAALITFDAAVRQDRDSVAGILYVVAAECLSTPYTEWRHSKLTKRFIEFFDELMPSDLDRIVAHGNFEEAFGTRRGVRTARALGRELLDRMYDYRSGQLHEGLSPSYHSLGTGFDPAKEARRGLLYDFAEAAILRYLDAPRVSLIGHPPVSFGSIMRKLISSGSPYEPKVGISRAVRAGPIVTVAGTAPLGPDGRTVGRGDAAAQARRCLEIIAAALEAAGASLRDVVRTRILLTRIDDWQAVAGVHGEFFRDIRPVNTIMQVSRFIDPDWLVEIEADAVLDDGGGAA